MKKNICSFWRFIRNAPLASKSMERQNVVFDLLTAEPPGKWSLTSNVNRLALLTAAYEPSD